MKPHILSVNLQDLAIFDLMGFHTQRSSMNGVSEGSAYLMSEAPPPRAYVLVMRTATVILWRETAPLEPFLYFPGSVSSALVFSAASCQRVSSRFSTKLASVVTVK